MYLDQDGKCAYTLERIDLSLLLNDPTAYEIDHIIPISISLDDSYNNKVLVTHTANQVKGNLTPVMAFRQNKFKNVNFEAYKANVLHLKSNRKDLRKKCEYLLYEKDINKYEEMKAFINRNLVDTSYANRVILNSLQSFFKSNSIDTKVFTVRGAITHQFRTKIKLDKERDLNFAHHGIDALIIASLMKQKTIQKTLNTFNIENGMILIHDTGEVIEIMEDDEYFDNQYISFIQKLYQLDNVNKTWSPSIDSDLKCHFSWKVDKKVNRQIADETIYSTRITSEGEKVVKKYKNIYDAKWCVLANDIMNNKYQKRYLMYLHDPQTFNKLIEIVQHYYEEFKSDSKKIKTKEDNIEFLVNPLYEYAQEHGKVTKYSKKNNGPEINCLKYFDGNLGNCIDITPKYTNEHTHPKGKRVVLQQISPYRTDFYQEKNGAYKFVTVRYCNIKYTQKTGKHIIDKEWYQSQLEKKKISTDAKFLFSMHHNELLEITEKTGTNLYKYTATNNDGKNVIEVKPIYYYEKKQIMKTIGKNTSNLRKMATNPVGDLFEIKEEILKFEF